MEPIRITTERLIKTWQGSIQKEQKKEDLLKDNLGRILTKKEQNHVRHYSLKDTRLTLGVDSSAWLYILNFKKRQLLRNLNQIFQPDEAIIEIRLRLDRDEAQSQIKR